MPPPLPIDFIAIHIASATWRVAYNARYLRAMGFGDYFLADRRASARRLFAASLGARRSSRSIFRAMLDAGRRQLMHTGCGCRYLPTQVSRRRIEFLFLRALQQFLGRGRAIALYRATGALYELTWPLRAMPALAFEQYRCQPASDIQYFDADAALMMPSRDKTCRSLKTWLAAATRSFFLLAHVDFAIPAHGCARVFSTRVEYSGHAVRRRRLAITRFADFRMRSAAAPPTIDFTLLPLMDFLDTLFCLSHDFELADAARLQRPLFTLSAAPTGREYRLLGQDDGRDALAFGFDGHIRWRSTPSGAIYSVTPAIFASSARARH